MTVQSQNIKHSSIDNERWFIDSQLNKSKKQRVFLLLLPITCDGNNMIYEIRIKKFAQDSIVWISDSHIVTVYYVYHSSQNYEL